MKAPIKGRLALHPASRFKSSYLAAVVKSGNVRLVLHQVSENPNNNYFSVNYVKVAPLVLDLWKILGMVGKWDSGLCCLTMTVQLAKIWPMCMFCWILTQRRGRNFGRCTDWYVIIILNTHCLEKRQANYCQIWGKSICPRTISPDVFCGCCFFFF